MLRPDDCNSNMHFCTFLSASSHCVFVVLTQFAFGVFVDIAPLLSLAGGTGNGAEAEIITVSPSVTDTSTPGLDWREFWVGRRETWKC